MFGRNAHVVRRAVRPDSRQTRDRRTRGRETLLSMEAGGAGAPRQGPVAMILAALGKWFRSRRK